MLKVEGKLVNFKEKNATLSLSAEEKSNVMGLRSLEQEVQKTKAQIKSLDQQSKSIQNMFGVSSIDAKVTGLVQDMPAVRAAITKLKTLQEDIKLQSVLVTPSNPKMIALKEEEAVLKQHLEDTIKESFVGKAKQLHQKVRPEDSILVSPTQQKLLTNYAEYKTERQGLEKKLQYLYQNIDNYKKKAKTLPSLALQEGHINREIAVNTSAYEALVGKYQELELLENMQISNARIIAPALIPAAPLQNRQQLNLVQGLLGGILMGAAAAFIVENLDKTVKSRQAVQEILNYNLLGCIPPFPMDKNKKRAAKGSRTKRSLDEVVVRSRPNSLISEAFGIVSTNLRVFNSDQKIDSIVISSSSPKEGKTTIAANLALTISNLGGKVLLIDADLRKPAQHKIWQLPNDIGLSNVIEDKLSIENIVHQVAPNLQVLTSGDKDTNPANIFNSLEMANFLEQVKEDYDFVLVDTAPITVAADVSILGKLVDGIVFVVRPGVSRSNAIRIAAGVLENANQNVLGLIINGTNMYGEYEYNYNYNYNYYNYYSRKKE
jgi:Mrp family chromosome partitioning ATPase